MFSRQSSIIALTTLTALAAPAAHAQLGRILRRGNPGQAATTAAPSRSSTPTGSGKLQIGSDTVRQLDRASVLFKPGGVAELRFFRGSTPYVFTGSWRSRRADIVSLQLDRRDGVPIEASGRVTMLKDTEVQHVEIGGTERGKTLQVSFQMDSPGTQEATASSQTHRGDGRLELGSGTSRELDKVSVLLQRGGTAELRFFRGSTPYIFTGTWTERRRNNVDLRLNWRDQQPITATGALTFRSDGELARILINGQERQARLNLSFQCEGAPAPSSSPFGYIDAADKARGR
jgi:hypothetical protein